MSGDEETTPVTQAIMRSEFETWRKERQKDEDAKADKTRSSLDLLSSLMVEKEADAVKRRKFAKWALGIAASLGTISFGGYELVLKPTEVAPEEVQKTVTKESNQLENRIDANTRKVERVGVGLIQQQELTVETTNYIGDKIDAAHPKVPPTEKPEALQDAETAVKKRADDAKAGKLFEDIDEALRVSEAAGG